MPRAPVPADQRQRVSRACGPCKISKRRCDSRLPCSACVKRNSVYACSYGDPQVDGQIKKAMLQASRQRSLSHSQKDLSPRSPTLDQQSDLSTILPPQSSSGVESQPDRGSVASIRVPVLTRSRMLFNAKKDRVFIGDAASLSFLQFLREILAQHLGPSTFTENAREDVTDDGGTPTTLPVDPKSDIEQKQALIESYFAASNGFLNLYTKEELATLMSETNNGEDIPDERTAALYIAIAIGGQCRVSGPLDLHYAKRYFTLGQNAAFSGMAEDPSITMTRNFLLMAFYMLGACRRNAAFMYLGIAAKSAFALGLHVTEHYALTTGEERRIRSNTWKTLRILDITVSTILGRISATPAMVVEPETFDTCQPEIISNRELSQDATYRAATIMDDIFHGLLRTKSIDVITAEEYLQKLNAWSSSLPNELRRFSRATPVKQSDQELLLGNIHVAGMYYWTVMLVTRPFLIFTMSNNSKNNIISPYDRISSAEINKLSQVCVSAAIYMAQMCRNALEPGSLLNNMCILKGWIYSAGLALGFSMVTNTDIRYDVEEAFNGARDVLRILSSSSPETEHYYDVLNRLAAAIFRYRQKLASESRQEHGALVAELLVMDDDEDGHRSTKRSVEVCDSILGGNESYVPGRNARYDMNHSGLDPLDRHTTADKELESLVGGEEVNWDLPLDPGQQADMEASWDTFAMQISQTFPFDNGFGQLFDGA